MFKTSLFILIFLVIASGSLSALGQNDEFSSENNEDRLFEIDPEIESTIAELNASLHALTSSLAVYENGEKIEESYSSMEIVYNNSVDTAQLSNYEHVSKKRKTEHPGFQHIN